MVDTKKRFKSFAELMGLGSGQIEFPDGGPRQSLPVPVRRQNQAVVAFMFCYWMIKPGPLRIWPPNKVAWFDPVSGDLITSAEVSPTDFGQTHSADDPMQEEDEDTLSVESFMEMRDRLFALYDILFEAWATAPSTRTTVLQGAAGEFLKIFDQISESPLRPYYNALGREYFEWTRKLAK